MASSVTDRLLHAGGGVALEACRTPPIDSRHGDHRSNPRLSLSPNAALGLSWSWSQSLEAYIEQPGTAIRAQTSKFVWQVGGFGKW